MSTAAARLIILLAMRPHAVRLFLGLLALLLSLATVLTAVRAQDGETAPPIDETHALPAACYGERPPGTVIDTLVLHYSSAINTAPQAPYDLENILRIYRGEAGGGPPVSSHYLIDRQGMIYRLVAEEKRAWHAGASKMPPPDGRENVNDFSLGIELMFRADDPPTDAQYEALARLTRELMLKYPAMTQRNIVGHDTIRAYWNLAHPESPAAAKPDPGSLFNWPRFFDTLD